MDMMVTFLQEYICDHNFMKLFNASNQLTWRSYKISIACAQTE